MAPRRSRRPSDPELGPQAASEFNGSFLRMEDDSLLAELFPSSSLMAGQHLAHVIQIVVDDRVVGVFDSELEDVVAAVLEQLDESLVVY